MSNNLPEAIVNAIRERKGPDFIITDAHTREISTRLEYDQNLDFVGANHKQVTINVKDLLADPALPWVQVKLDPRLADTLFGREGCQQRAWREPERPPLVSEGW